MVALEDQESRHNLTMEARLTEVRLQEEAKLNLEREQRAKLEKQNMVLGQQIDDLKKQILQLTEQNELQFAEWKHAIQTKETEWRVLIERVQLEKDKEVYTIQDQLKTEHESETEKWKEQLRSKGRRFNHTHLLLTQKNSTTSC